MGYVALIEKISRLGLAAVRRTKAGREALKKFSNSKKFKAFMKKFNESKSKKQLDKAKEFRAKNVKPKTTPKKPNKNIKDIKKVNQKPKTKKINANKSDGKSTTTGTTKPGTRTKTPTGTTKPGTKSFVGKGAAIGGGLLVAGAIIKSKSKKDKDKKTETQSTPKPVPKAPKGFKDKGSKGRGKGGFTMDDMLDKNVRGVPAGFKAKGSQAKAKGKFGSNISFTSKDVKTLRQNASDLKKQINQLDITNMQKLRLKKLIDTRDPGYSMGESYNRAFNEVKRRVKDNKLNFAIDVSGYAG